MTAPLDRNVGEWDGCAVVAVRGQHGPAPTTDLRTTLLQCLAERPDALLVDLTGVEPADEIELSEVMAVVRQAAVWPAIPVLLCAPSPDVSVLLKGKRLTVQPSVAAAAQAVAGGRIAVPAVSDQLPPIAGTPRRARTLATEACIQWDLPELVGPASVVVSELVSNAVEHAGTLITVELRRHPRSVHVAVRDGSPEPPRQPDPGRDGTEPGRGLLLVSTLAAQWGYLPARDGKVVWATLAA